MRFNPVRSLGLLFSMLFLVASCGGDSSTGPNDEPMLSSVDVTPANSQLAAIGATQQLSAAARDDQGGTVSGASIAWSSSNTGVATVNANGLVTAVGNGTTTITAQATDSGDTASGTASVTVQQVATEVTLTAPQEMLTAGQNMQLTASSADANGNAIEDGDYDYGSSNEAVATVNATGLVTALSSGQTTLSATLDSESDEVELMVVVGEVVFEEDAEISGTLEATTFTIAAGATVTATGDVSIQASDAVEIAGTLTGDCVEIVVTGGAGMNLTGSIANDCSTGEGGPGISLLAAGPLTVNGAAITSGGPVDLANDGVPAAVSGLGAAGQVGSPTCTFQSMIIAFLPSQAPSGDPGSPGDDIGIKCVGAATYVGGNQIEAQTGGNGADDAGSADTAGGDGGKGGGVRLESLEGDIIFQNNTFGGSQGTGVVAGDGGRGGDAEAEGDDTDRNAEAVGGDGAEGGDISIQALNGDITIEGMGGLRVHVGDGGRGGHATAEGDDGSQPSEDGGTASALGGDGGDSGAWSMTSIDEGGAAPARAISGRDDIIQDGGNGGVGGDSDGVGGNGADGDASSPPGGDGGDITSEAGDGGDAVEAAPAILGIGDGGDGGWSYWSSGVGGDGADLCFGMAGGPGGDGGDGLGFGFGLGGLGGAGGVDGEDSVLEGTGDGGMGGDGEGPGAGGMGGNNGTADAGTDAWRPGSPGMGCMTMIDVELMTDPEKDPSGHEPFTQIAATVTQLKLTLLGSAIVIEGDGNWIEVSGTVDEEGNFSASGTGEAAGFTGVSALFEGTIERDETGMPVYITGTYTVGGNGALPGGQPVIYMVMGGEPAEPPAPSTAMVTVDDNFFDPSAVTVAPGGTVTWTWAGSVGHNVTFSTTLIDSAPTQTTGTHEATMPTMPGVYNYQCTIHTGMEGSVTVQ